MNSVSQSLSEDEIAAAIMAVLEGRGPQPEGMSKEGAISTLLQELPDAPPADVTEAVARLVVEDG